MNSPFSQATADLHTVRDYLRFAVSRFYQAELFFGHGSSGAYDEAVYLILHTLHLPLDRLEPFFDARLTASERAEVLNIIQRRVQERIPAAYLTHEAFLVFMWMNVSSCRAPSSRNYCAPNSRRG
jgi:ribosomal protein L3 glutamine methyltransferase